MSNKPTFESNMRALRYPQGYDIAVFTGTELARIDEILWSLVYKQEYDLDENGLPQCAGLPDDLRIAIYQWCLKQRNKPSVEQIDEFLSRQRIINGRLRGIR